MIKLNKDIKNFFVILAVALFLCGVFVNIGQLAVECLNTIQQNLELKVFLDSAKAAYENAEKIARSNPWYYPQSLCYLYLFPNLAFWPTVIFAATGGFGSFGIAFHPFISIAACWVTMYYDRAKLCKGDTYATIPEEQVDAMLSELPETSTILLDFLSNIFPLFILAGYLAFWLVFLIYIQFVKA